MTRTALLIAAGSLLCVLPQQTFRARSDIVVLDVSVRDGRRPVRNLTSADFELRDNGVRQAILDFSQGAIPLDVTLMLDVSGSMTVAKRRAIERAIAQVNTSLVAGDRVAVLAFDRRITERSPLREPPAAAELSLVGVGTAIYDAVLLSLATPPAPERRALAIVMTDGQDNASFFDRRTVLATAEFSATQHAFVVVRAGSIGPNREVLDTFEQIARDSGGELIRIDHDEQLSEAFLAAIDGFRHNYVIRYAPSNAAAGWHDVSVRLTNGRYTVRTRRGYQVAEREDPRAAVPAR